MARNCRDCETCTKPGFARWGQWWACATMHFFSMGISYVIKKGTRRHCPQCDHLETSHRKREDGSFMD